MKKRHTKQETQLLSVLAQLNQLGVLLELD